MSGVLRSIATGDQRAARRSDLIFEKAKKKKKKPDHRENAPDHVLEGRVLDRDFAGFVLAPFARRISALFKLPRRAHGLVTRRFATP